MKKLTTKQIRDKFARLKSERGNFEQQWQEILDYVVPRKNNVLTKRSPGEKRNFQVLDNTGMVSNELLAGALHGFLTNPYGQWFEFTTGDTRLDNDDDVRLWMQDTARRTLHIISNSNFQTEVHELYIDMPSVCTGCMYIDEDKRDVVRFSTKFIGDYYIDENHLGIVDEIYRSWPWTADKIVAEFGYENVGNDVQKAYQKGDSMTFMVLQAVYPAMMVDKDGSGYHSVYFLDKEDHILREEKYQTFPYAVPRWAKATGEKYGRGPGMVALPELKVLHKMAETMLIGAQKVVDPPLQMEDDGVILPLITRPGGINFRRAGSDQIRPIFNDTRLDFGYQAMEDRRKRVRDAYYVDQLKLQSGGPMMTATEVMQRTEEAMRLLGPMLGRMETEFLRVTIDRVFDIAMRRGKYLPVPEALKGKRIDVRYSSFIAKAQRMGEAQNMLRAIEFITPFIQLDPGVKDNFNGDIAVRMAGQMYSLPQEIIRPYAEVAARREASQQAMAAQQQAMAQQQQAETALTQTEVIQNTGALE